MARALLCGLTGVACLPVPGRAATWDFTSQGQLDAAYDDNVRMLPLQPVGSGSAVAQAAARLTYRSNDLLYQLEPRLVMARYRAEPLLNHAEQYLTATLRNDNERGSASMALSAVRDTTLTSELGSTGLTEVNKVRLGRSATLQLSRSLSERWQLGAQLGTNRYDYVDAGNSGLVSYRYDSGTTYANYSLTEQSTLSARVTLGHLQIPDLALLDKHSESLALGYSRRLAAAWQLSAMAGPSRTTDRNGRDSGAVLTAALGRSTERSSVTLSGSRELAASGRGVLNQRDELHLALTRAWSPRWSGDLGVTIVRQTEVLPTTANRLYDVSYDELSASIVGRMSERWQLVLSAGYARQLDNSASAQNARRTRIGLGLRRTGLERRAALER